MLNAGTWMLYTVGILLVSLFVYVVA